MEQYPVNISRTLEEAGIIFFFFLGGLFFSVAVVFLDWCVLFSFFFLEDTITMHTISISICVIGKIKVHLISHPSLTPWFAAYELIRIHGDALEARFFERNDDVFFFQT